MKKEHSAHASASGSATGWKYSAACSCGWRQDDLPTFESAFDAEKRHLHEHGLLTRDERLALRDKVHVFSNGTEHMIWTERNCDRCLLGYDVAPEGWKCPIEKAIGEAMFDEDSAMDRELAIRGGLAPRPQRDCPERVPN